MMKYIILVVSIIIVANISQKDIDTKQLIDNVYFSSQSSTDEYFCNVFLHFDRDSLYIFNTASYPKIYKFKIDYYKNRIELSNQALNNYELEMLKSDQKITLLDKSNKIAYNDSIELNKIKIGTINQKLMAKPPDNYWGAELSRREKKDSVFFSFDKLDNRIDYQVLNSYYKNKSSIVHNDYPFRVSNVSQDLNLIMLGINHFVITNFTKDNFTFLTPNCPNKGITKTSLDKLKINEKIDLSGTWKRIKSKKGDGLPDKIKFDKDNIYLKEKKLQYFTALNGKFLHLANYKSVVENQAIHFSDVNDFKIKKFENDTLILNYEIHHLECSDTYVREN